MKFYAGVTDTNWFDFLHHLAARASDSSVPLELLDEVNFWQPSPDSQFRALHQGDLFLFKLHRGVRTSHKDLIAGGGVFASYSTFPISLAWEAFGQKNGAISFLDLRRQIVHYRRIEDDPREDFRIGCIILTQPFFLSEIAWFPAPEWKPSIVRGKGYDIDSEAGRFIWDNLAATWRQQKDFDLDKDALRIQASAARYGKEMTIRPRLGQGAFKLAVTEAYHRSCAITEEHTLPALESAHIKPYALGGPHQINNGLLLRSDIHRLFDGGYITVTPELRIEVSRRIKDEFENGRCYYPFDGKRLHHVPTHSDNLPSPELLAWHNENRFKG